MTKIQRLLICLTYLGFGGIGFVGCSSPRTENSNEKKDSRFTVLLSKYKTISFDTLKVEFKSGDNEQNPFYGLSIDSNDFKLFPKYFKESNYHEFYACCKFRLDSSQWALITRTPSIYESASVKLLICDLHCDSIVYFCELTDDKGDAGTFFNKTSWLYKTNNRYESFTKVYAYYDARIMSNGTDTSITQETNYYILKLRKTKFDTVKNDLTGLINHFN